LLTNQLQLLHHKVVDMVLIWAVWVTKIESDLIASRNKKNLLDFSGRFFYTKK
jgi:hypothetical protein